MFFSQILCNTTLASNWWALTHASAWSGTICSVVKKNKALKCINCLLKRLVHWRVERQVCSPDSVTSLMLLKQSPKGFEAVPAQVCRRCVRRPGRSGGLWLAPPAPPSVRYGAARQSLPSGWEALATNEPAARTSHWTEHTRGAFIHTVWRNNVTKIHLIHFLIHTIMMSGVGKNF